MRRLKGIVVWDHKVTNLKAIHNTIPTLILRKRLFEITKLRIWKQFTTSWQGINILSCCLRSQSYEFESNSQLSQQEYHHYYVVWDHKVTNLKAIHNNKLPRSRIRQSCLRSQSYEFESNSQHLNDQMSSNKCCLRSQSYEFESNSQLQEYVKWFDLRCLRSQSYEFESNSQQNENSESPIESCLRSQSYEFESNSQHHASRYLPCAVVWDHKVTNLKSNYKKTM